MFGLSIPILGQYNSQLSHHSPPPRVVILPPPLSDALLVARQQLLHLLRLIPLEMQPRHPLPPSHPLRHAPPDPPPPSSPQRRMDVAGQLPPLRRRVSVRGERKAPPDRRIAEVGGHIYADDLHRLPVHGSHAEGLRRLSQYPSPAGLRANYLVLQAALRRLVQHRGHVTRQRLGGATLAHGLIRREAGRGQNLLPREGRGAGGRLLEESAVQRTAPSALRREVDG
mmetsp:Transcript_24520/g.56043  ORF Transcript_24520/g.56043 Transcript_24520/m.56043 type:complete len:226 (+) Transcript_24520:147-824(+)